MRASVTRAGDATQEGLRHVGGPELADDASREAEWFAAPYFPWDGTGDEPLDRLRARVDILSLRLRDARRAGGPVG